MRHSTRARRRRAGAAQTGGFLWKACGFMVSISTATHCTRQAPLPRNDGSIRSRCTAVTLWTVRSYPAHADFITSTGLAEFLEDDEFGRLLGVFYDVLAPGGVLITSGMQRRRFSDYLLQLAEIPTHYRSAEDLRRIAGAWPFREITTRSDPNGIQSDSEGAEVSVRLFHKNARLVFVI